MIVMRDRAESAAHVIGGSRPLALCTKFLGPKATAGIAVLVDAKARVSDSRCPRVGLTSVVRGADLK